MQDRPEPRRSPVVVTLANVEAESIQWLWPSRIPLGAVSLLFGDPGLGKSLASLDIAARVSAGRPFPDCQHIDNPAGTVILLSAEDDLAITIRPRLDAALADVSKVIALQAIRETDPEDGKTRDAPFSMLADLDMLRVTLDEYRDARLLVVDPISAYLGAADTHKNSEVRAILSPLCDLAAEYRVAVLCVTHLNKSTGGNALYRATGSLAFIAAARTAWVVAKDKEDESRRLVLPAKFNVGPEPDGMAFRVADSEDYPGIGVINWEANSVRMTANEALNDSRDGEGAERSEAAQWLREALEFGPVAANDLKRRAGGDGISIRTLRRAKDSLKVKSRRDGFGTGGQWVWELSEVDTYGRPIPTTPKVAPFEQQQESMRESVDMYGAIGGQPSIDVQGEGNGNGWHPKAGPVEGGRSWER